MKKYFVCILCFVFLFAGCSFSGDRIKEPVNFYYLQAEYPYQEDAGVIVLEEREASGHRDSLPYLLALYQMGPSSEELKLPFPEGTRVTVAEQTEDTVILSISSTSLTDAQFTLASACLTLTCSELTNIQNITVTDGQRTVTMSPDTITLLDNTTIDPTEDLK